MSKLSEAKCVACDVNAPKVTHDEVTELMDQTPGWQITKEDDVNKLEKKFFFKDWSEAIAFTNQVGEIAEQQNHHPLVVTEWGRVKVVWWTHKIGGLHKNDFIMAAKVEVLATQHSVERKAKAITDK